MNKTWWSDSSGRIEFQLYDTHVDELQGGDNLPYIQEIMPKYEDVFNMIDEKLLINTAIEYGCKDYGSEGTPTLKEAKEFILWCALWETYDNI